MPVTTADSSTGARRYVVLAALSLLYILLMAATFNSLGQVLPFMVKDLGLSWAAAGLGFTLLGLACGLASLAPAAMIRRIGVGATLAVGTAMLIAGFLCIAETRGATLYQAGTLLLGLGFCCCATVPAVHVISTSFAQPARALGTYFTVGGLGAVAGPPFFYVVNEASGGWRGYWLICAAASLAIGGFATLATWRRMGPGRSAEDQAIPEASWTVRDALATPQLWVVVAAYTGCLLINTTVHSFAFQQLMDHGVGKATATALISLAAAIAAAGSAVAGLIGGRFDGRRLTLLSLAMLSLTALSLAVAQGWLALIAFTVSMGVGLGFSYVGTAMLLGDWFGRAATLELYSVMTLVSTSAALGPAIGGVVRDRTGSFSPIFVGIAVFALALLAAVLIARRPLPQRVRPSLPLAG